jgi:hypothetical protein
MLGRSRRATGEAPLDQSMEFDAQQIWLFHENGDDFL